MAYIIHDQMRKSYILKCATAVAAALFVCLPAMAFDVDGMSYEVNDAAAKTVTLTQGKSSSTHVTVPETVSNGGETYTVNTIGQNAFARCEVVGQVTLPVTVTRLEFYAFYELDAIGIRIRGDLDYVEFGAFYGNKVKSIICYSTTYFTQDLGVLVNAEKTMIIACPGQPSNEKWKSPNLTIPEGYEYIAPYAFAENQNLTGITIPASVKAIGVGAFEQCPNLKSINIQGSDTQVGDRAFMGCEQVTSLSLPTGLKTLGQYAFFDLMSLTTVRLPEGMESTGIQSFGNCGLTTIHFPSTLRTIADRTFSTCESLKTVNLPESLDTIGYAAFINCDLTAIDLKNVRYVGGQALSNNYNLTTITGGEQLDFMGNAMFYGCRSLSSVTLPSSVRVMEGTTFYLCSGLQSLTLSAGVEEIGPGITVGTTSLNAIQIDPANTHYAVQDGWLYGSDLKRLVAIPGAATSVLTIPTGVTSIGSQAGRRLAITELVTQAGLKTLESAAFMQCGSLQKVVLSNTVEMLESNAFASCTAITEVTSLNRVPPTGGVFSDEVCAAATLRVPRGSLAAYQADENWTRFQNIEEIDVEEPGVPGDLTGDGAVDVEDVNAIINLILEKITADQLAGNTDINGDGDTDIADVNEIINMVLMQ
ncbi:MAG: leucine-rich repeat protein [Muribaculaceae bacterium]|nr:leucine-rich repeat protein [Muribaculaceae bacterium]